MTPIGVPATAFIILSVFGYTASLARDVNCVRHARVIAHVKGKLYSQYRNGPRQYDDWTYPPV